jgi:hypothetical protein
MNDAHPGGMPNIGGPPGLGQQVHRYAPLAEATLQLVVDAIDELAHAQPGHMAVVVTTLPAQEGQRMQSRRVKGSYHVLAYAVWSTGDITPIIWGDLGPLTIPANIPQDWTLI